MFKCTQIAPYTSFTTDLSNAVSLLSVAISGDFTRGRAVQQSVFPQQNEDCYADANL